MVPFEEDNLKGYKLLLRIEIVLRECLRESLREQSGQHWRRMLPGDLLVKIRNAQREENRPQFNHVLLGPLYYLTLGELIPMLRQKPGRPTADRFGGQNFVSQLENILGPRNALCHGRSISSIGLGAIESLYKQMENVLTPDGFAKATSSPDTGKFPDEAARELIPWFEKVKSILSELRRPIPVDDCYWLATRQYWWGDTELSGFDCTPTDQAVALIEDYNLLPSGVGSAAVRQRFCENHCLLATLNNARKEVAKILL
jgi:hypothetical protein